MPIQIIEENKRPSFSQRLGGLIDTASNYYKEQSQEKEKEKKRQAVSALAGEDVANLPEELQKIYFNETLKGQNQQAQYGQELRGQQEVEGRDFNVIKNTFGDKFADLWRSVPVGGRTALVQSAIEAGQRGQNISDVIQGFQQQPEMNVRNDQNVSNNGQDALKKPEKLIDYDKGLTPKERAKRQDDRYAKNLPLFQESQKKRNSLNMIGEELEILEELSPQIGSLQKLNINPMSGDLLIPGLASPESQRFVKTVNDFTINAKDSYGSRVTNFDLTQFMRRLPTLANSEEGRRQIIDQMKIINKMNQEYENSLHDVIEEYGGVRNIDYDRAEELANKRSKSKVDELKKDFKKIGADQDKSYRNVIKEKKKNVPPGMVLMEKDGKFGYVSEKEVKEAEKDGATLL